MSRAMQCANVRSLGAAHSHNTPESRTTPRTLEQQTSLKALAGAVLGRTLPRTLPAQSATYSAGIVQAIPPDLEHLIVRAGAFWEYSPEDYALIREVARRDPAGLRRALLADPLLPYMHGRILDEMRRPTP